MFVLLELIKEIMTISKLEGDFPLRRDLPYSKLELTSLAILAMTVWSDQRLLWRLDQAALAMTI